MSVYYSIAGQYAVGDALCISANSSTGLWNAASCYDAKPFVCKFAPVTSEESPKPKPPSGPPADGPKPSSPAGGHPTPPPGNHTHPPGPPAGPKVTCEKEWTYSDVTAKCYKVGEMLGFSTKTILGRQKRATRATSSESADVRCRVREGAVDPQYARERRRAE